MKIKLTSLMVDDQDKALAFYTEVLGFRKKNEIPMGPYRWLTVVSPDDPDGTELSLEPNATQPDASFNRQCFLKRFLWSPLKSMISEQKPSACANEA
jgi:catechol 2,3-dioxygenase-like lactoylglutathione lyase family enzyme